MLFSWPFLRRAGESSCKGSHDEEREQCTGLPSRYLDVRESDDITAEVLLPSFLIHASSLSVLRTIGTVRRRTLLVLFRPA